MWGDLCTKNTLKMSVQGIFLVSVFSVMACAPSNPPYISTYDPVLAGAPFGRLTPADGRDAMRVLVVGDGGVEGRDCSPAVSYAGQLEMNLGWRVDVDVSVDGGYTSSVDRPVPVVSERVARISQDPGVGDYDLVILQAGSADVGRPSGELVVGVQNAIVEARRLAPGTAIVVIGLLSGSSSPSGDSERNYNDIARVALAAEGVGFVRTFDLRFEQNSESGIPLAGGCLMIASEVADYLRGLHVIPGN